MGVQAQGLGSRAVGLRFGLFLESQSSSGFTHPAPPTQADLYSFNLTLLSKALGEGRGSELGVQAGVCLGLGVGLQGLGFRVEGRGFPVWSSGFVPIGPVAGLGIEILSSVVSEER